MSRTETNTTHSDDEQSIFNGFDDSDADEDAPVSLHTLHAINNFGATASPVSPLTSICQYENPQTGQRLRRRVHSSSDGGSKRQSKVSGGRPAVNKLVTEDLDSDDQRIVELKNQGYSDNVICKRLAEEGRVRYKPGTVNSRALRIRRMQEKLEDERLDDELSDWHLGEVRMFSVHTRMSMLSLTQDELLEETVETMETQFQYEMQKLIDKRWKGISDLLNPKLEGGKRKYTAVACKERWEALKTNTGLLPIELDPDQEGRKQLRESRITRNKRLRAEAKREVQRVKEAEQKARDEKKRLRNNKMVEKAQAKLEREAEKAEMQRIVAEKKAGKLRKMEERKQAREAWRADIDKKRRIRELEERVYRKITGKSLNRLRRIHGNDDNFRDSIQGLSDDEELDHTGDERDDDEEQIRQTKEVGDMPDLVSDREEDQFLEGTDDDEYEDIESEIEVIQQVKKIQGEYRDTREPTQHHEYAELATLLHARGLPPRGVHESHPELVARLAAMDNLLTSSQVSDLLLPFFDRTKVSKEAKILRLQNHDARNSAAGYSGIKSTDEEFVKGYEGYSGRFRR